MIILAGDVGGTKTNLALFQYSKGQLAIIVETIYPSKDYPDLETIIRAFLEQHHFDKAIDAACFGVAGPVVKEHCRLSNLSWTIRTFDLQYLLDCEEVSLLNDLEAIGYGIPLLKQQQLLNLNPSATQRAGNSALIAAGTGLGEALLYWDGQEFRPSASEGGNTDFAPRNELQIELLRYLLQRFPHVSYERIVSGIGLVNVYNFLKDYGLGREPAWLTEQLRINDAAAVIGATAMAGKNELCVQTLNLFTEVYGAEAGNLALKFMSFGGVYVGGGIAPKVSSYLQAGKFMKSFTDKGAFSELVASMPVYVILEPKTGLLGAARWASLF